MFGKHVEGSELFGEQTRRIAKRLELECIARSIVEEERRLFANFPWKANAGLDDEIDSSVLQTLCESVPLRPLKYYAKVRNRDILAIDFVGMRRRAKRLTGGIDMRDELMTKKIEVYPFMSGASLWATKERTVELAR